MKIHGFLYSSKQYELQLQRQIRHSVIFFALIGKDQLLKKKPGTYLHVQLIKGSIFRKKQMYQRAN